jgi:hypothetical protein
MTYHKLQKGKVVRQSERSIAQPRPRLVPAGFGILHSVTSNQRNVAFRLYLVKIIQTLTN